MAHTTMDMVFTNSHTTPLYSTSWTPSTEGQYAGTCIFLVLLGMTLRLLFAGKSLLEQRWANQARNRRYIVVKGRTPEAERIQDDPNAKDQALLTAQGVEEKVKVVRAPSDAAIPFRLSVDVPRAFLSLIIAGVAYLLMLAVMTLNIGYFFSVLAGTFVGELAVGRYAALSERH